jgi:hypothetical protein
MLDLDRTESLRGVQADEWSKRRRSKELPCAGSALGAAALSIATAPRGSLALRVSVQSIEVDA